MKLILINSYLQKFDTLRIDSLKNISELSELRSEIYSAIESYIKKYNKEDVFTDILNHIALDVNYEIEKECELLSISTGGVI
ncbi:hypothetical protein ACOL3G_10675 [Aliarcobacter butzleri]|uniref:hypothetical protein n=1 Tax=Aliarcobacter butzleri TaxID=28197 RepID=UPI00125EF29A|nr:hypothetical protein [Aliarcobacter butzleri]MCG3687334.1 hypothetical protein [Aliarcobacter butzleri]MDN5112685.1 hypothetical protein [Aliarcobacter butzleri]